MNLPGSSLDEGDLGKLAEAGIPSELAERALLRRVDSTTGGAIVGRNGHGDYAGILFPYVWPGEDRVREYRLRRDKPDLELRADGSHKDRAKYLFPPGRGNLLYFVPGTTVEALQDATLPILLTEGEKKVLALCGLNLRVQPVGLGGVWNWKGTIGKATGPNGDRRNVTGVISDFDRLTWKDRAVTIVFDANVATNTSVAAARRELAKELTGRGAVVSLVDVPAVPGVNGIDDLIGLWGPDRVRELLAGARPWDRQLLEFPLNDYGNAQRIISAESDRLRYCHAFKKWLVYDGRRWQVDESDRARGIAQQVMIEFIRQAVKAGNEQVIKFASGSLSSRRLTDALREAMPHLAISVAELDTDPDLLNFQNGTVDLRSGELLPHSPERFITKLVHHDYRPEAAAALRIFARFLAEILDDRQDLIDYIQIALGYSLTGRTIEKAMFITIGPKNGGKSTLLTTIRTLVREYSAILMVDSLMSRMEDNNSQSDLADLRGARFVMTSEAEENHTLSQAKLKSLTQGMGDVKAVRKFENPTMFPATHKLWLDTNQKPRIRNGDDDATFFRLHPIPLNVSIPAERRDRDLPAKLLLEAEGILAWMAAGARRWYDEGLPIPPDVQRAREEWQEESDKIGAFLSECCVLGEGEVRGSELYKAYTRWAECSGEKPVTNTAFGRKLKSRQGITWRESRGTIYTGLEVVS